MPPNKKIKILYLFPGPIYRPDLPDFKGRFEMLSTDFEGEIYSWSGDAKFREYPIGSFIYRGLFCKSSGLFQKCRSMKHIFCNALRYHKQNRVDMIVCYEPMFTGFIGVLLKLLTRAKLIVEINSERYDGALAAFYGKNIFILIKGFIFKILCRCTIFFADGIKVLMNATKFSLPTGFQKKKIFIFHDFVATHYFQKDRTFQKEILFAGYPFHLKGVDALIKAFHAIQGKYPEFSLQLIGHQLKEDAQLFFRSGELDHRKIFHKGMYYDELREYFLRCYCFVLPSRTEGMGRVLIEAMASGKPVIGSNVGGIPDVIEDGRNGFLFESENVNDLAAKLRMLLSDPDLARRMGEEGRKIVDEKFSSQKYVENFKKMIDMVIV